MSLSDWALNIFVFVAYSVEKDLKITVPPWFLYINQVLALTAPGFTLFRPPLCAGVHVSTWVCRVSSPFWNFSHVSCLVELRMRLLFQIPDSSIFIILWLFIFCCLLWFSGSLNPKRQSYISLGKKKESLHRKEEESGASALLMRLYIGKQN